MPEEKKGRVIPGTETVPPQILDEHLMDDADEEGRSASAHAVVDAWYAEHEQKLEAAKSAKAEEVVNK